MQKKISIIILSGPSGVGKTTVWDALHRTHSDRLERIITSTARAIRPTEEEGKHYYFLSRETFEERITSSDMIEYALVHGNYYGSTLSELKRIIGLGKSPVYIIDPQGMIHLKPLLEKQGYSVKTIFLIPPSIDELRFRLSGRGTENQSDLELRLANAMVEMEEEAFYNHRIVNDSLDDTVERLAEIIFE